MPQSPRLPAAEVRKNLMNQLAQQDHQPFREILADAVSVKPKKKAWRELANTDPEKYTRAVNQLRKAAGYIDKTEHHQINHSASDLAATLVARYGPAKARQMLELHGLPVELVPDAIEGELVDTESASDAA